MPRRPAPVLPAADAEAAAGALEGGGRDADGAGGVGERETAEGVDEGGGDDYRLPCQGTNGSAARRNAQDRMSCTSCTMLLSDADCHHVCIIRSDLHGHMFLADNAGKRASCAGRAMDV